MNATLHPTMAGVLNGFMTQKQRATPPRFEQTYCSQCGGDTGPGDHGHSSCSTHRPPVQRAESLDTEVGDGKADVTVKFNVDADGDIEDVQVFMYGTDVDIIHALDYRQLDELKDKCWKSYLDDVKDRNADARIEAYRDRMEWA